MVCEKGDGIMPNYVLYLIEFITAFLLVYLYHKLIIIRKYKKYAKKSLKNMDKYKIPSELLLFIKMINIDEKKVDKIKLLNILAIVNSLDIAIILLLTELVNNIVLKLLIAIAAVFVIVIFSYKLLGFYYKKKGLVKNV